MNFSPEIETKLQRYKQFYEHPEKGQLLITIPPYTYSPPPWDGRVNHPRSGSFPFEEPEHMAENHVGFERYFASHTRDLADDYISSVSPAYGVGLSSAFFTDATLIPGEGTSWVRPVLNELKDMHNLYFRSNGFWVDIIRRYMKRANELWEGDFCVNFIGAFAPSDMANAIRGDDLFYDLYDYPEQVDRFLTICVDAVIALYQELHPYIWAPDGGFCAGGLWMPGEGIFLSEDAADLCSPEVYKRFFFSQTQRLIDEIGGAYVHHHAIGWKIHGEIAKLQNLRFLEFSWDPNCPRPVDHLDELLEQSLSVPLQIRCTLRDLKERIEQMKQGRLALMVNVDTLEEAKEAVRLVRKHSIL